MLSAERAADVLSALDGMLTARRTVLIIAAD
jgi:hypothetical protein